MSIKHCYKLILSIALITVLIISISIFAYADPLAGAIAGGMAASGVTVTTIGGSIAGLNDMIGGYTGQSDIPLSLDDEYVYYHKSAGTSGGVNYDEIWYSNDYSKYIQSEGLGYILDKSINPNSSGTLASGYGYMDGLPLYNIDGAVRSSNFITDTISDVYPCSVWELLCYKQTPDSRYYRFYNSIYYNAPESEKLYWTTLQESSFPITSIIEVNTQNSRVRSKSVTATGNTKYTNYVDGSLVGLDYNPFTFNYTSVNINTSAITSQFYRVRIPSSILAGSGLATGTYTVASGSGSTANKTISEGIAAAIIAGTVVNSEYTNDPFPVSPSPEPTPTPTPFPTDALGDIPYDTFMGDIQNTVNEQTEDINDTIGLGVGVIEGALDTIGQSIISKLNQIEQTIDIIGQSIEDALDSAAESVSDTIGLGVTSITGWLSDIYDAVIDGVADLVDAIEGIAEAVIEAIESFFETLFGDIQSAFGGWIADISDAFGIWHYVVEWLTCISTYFTFMRTIASGMPSCFWSPVLALVAGTIVLGVYKRFLQ